MSPKNTSQSECMEKGSYSQPTEGITCYASLFGTWLCAAQSFSDDSLSAYLCLPTSHTPPSRLAIQEERHHLSTHSRTRGTLWRAGASCQCTGHSEKLLCGLCGTQCGTRLGIIFTIFHKVLALEVIFRKYVQKVACFSGAFGLLYSYTIDPSIRTAICPCVTATPQMMLQNRKRPPFWF